MKVLIHFGFPKTLSSSLQFGLFKSLHEMGLVNLKTWRLNDTNESLDSRPSSRLFNNAAITDNYIKFNKVLLNILSDESFTAPIKLRRNNYGNNIEDPFSFPEKIKKQITLEYGKNVDFIPLIVIRNQPSLIYSQYVEEYNLKKYKNVDLIFNDDGEIDLKGFEIYNYYKYISVLESVYGVGKVNVLLFEEFISNFSMSCKKLSNIIKIDKILVETLMSNSHINKKEKTSSGYYTKDGATIVPFLTDMQKKQIRNFYKKDNINLQKILPHCVNLSEFGYL